MRARIDRRRMAGMSGLGFLLLLLLIGFFALLVIRLFPVYLEHYNVSASLRSLTTEPREGGLDSARIRELLLRRFEINDVTHVNGKHIQIEPTSEGTRVAIAYEVRKPFMANVDLVVSFRDAVMLPRK